MKIDIICVGKIKEEYFRGGVAEYLKRLKRYATVSIIEVADEPTPDGASAAIEEQIKAKEGEKILARIAPSAYKIALAIDGKGLSSEDFAQRLEALGVNGVSHIQFIIGGSLGLSESVLNAADIRLSFSAMTFPHQLMRVILLEQIYRAYRIINHEPYHK